MSNQEYDPNYQVESDCPSRLKKQMEAFIGDLEDLQMEYIEINREQDHAEILNQMGYNSAVSDINKEINNLINRYKLQV